MEKKIGQKFILTSHAPYGIFGHNTKFFPKFIEVEITEIKKDIPGEFSGNPQGDGYLAKGSDGYFYGYNYPRFNEGYRETIWTRYCSNSEFKKLTEKEKKEMAKDYIWCDITLYQCPALPTFVANFNVKLLFCEKHQHLYYEYEECFYCRHAPDYEREVVMNLKEHKWLGWYYKRIVKTI